MGSTLYLGTHPENMADRLASSLAEAARSGDCFVPVRIVVPNRYLGKWLRLHLARQLGVAINLRIQPYLEKLLWDLCREIDGRTFERPLQLLTEDDYQLMLVAALLEDGTAAAEKPLRDYLGLRGGQPGRDYWRRLWQLGGKLSALLRDYEYHRQHELILPWLAGKDGTPKAPDRELPMERAQHALFDRVVHPDHGLRTLLGLALGKEVRTLPQYIGEVRELQPAELRPIEGRPAVHLFGLTQISALHVHTLGWLGERFDLHVYHLNPLAGHLPKQPSAAAKVRTALRTVASRFGESADKHEGHELLRLWGRAGAEALGLMAELLEGKEPFAAELVQAPEPKKRTVLAALQESCCGREPTSGKMDQDTSVQMVACPGVFREVETVYQSIVHNLQNDPGLKQTDIAVLATDMARYRPVIQAVFDREPRHIVYNLADYSAAELSPFGHAVIGLLDLALESFTRSRVFGVLLNPCFLAWQEVDREEAGKWLDWVEALGVFHGWDKKDRQDRGHVASALYSWRLGLQRLRLGRLMDVADERLDAPATCYEGVIPYADLDSGDREQLDAFGRSVEGLLPRLLNLRSKPRKGADWAKDLRNLIDDFLAVPEDRPEEEQVRAALFASLDRLQLLDEMASPEEKQRGLPLALVREFVQDSLETLTAMAGEFLTDGVTVSALQPLLPVPFRIIYVLGLGEGFPGSNTLTALDLRDRHRQPGDIRPAEMNRYLFLQTLLAARDRVYLSYNCKDLQEDRPLHRSSALNQLERYLKAHVVAGSKFEVANAPLRSSDPKLLHPPASATDCLVSYSKHDRLLAIEEAQAGGTVLLTQKQSAELDKLLQDARHEFKLPEVPSSASAAMPTLSLTELRNFLVCPIEAALKRHLGLYDDEERAPADDEPFATDRLSGYGLVTEALRRFINRAVKESVDTALADWRQQFGALYDDWRLRGRVPDGAFAQVDRARFEQRLHERIEGPGGLAEFVGHRAQAHFAGPVLLGESVTPVGAQTRFAALTLPLTNGTGNGLPSFIRLVGMMPLVWQGADAIDVLILTSKSAKKVPDGRLSVPFLEPLLWYLALKCEPEACAGTSKISTWLGKRSFRVHVVHQDGMVQLAYEADDFKVTEARTYLAELVKECLDRSSYDLLPFELVVLKDSLRVAFEGEESSAIREEYVAAFTEVVAGDGESDHPSYWPMQLLEIIEARVPPDAYDKIRRRFRLLDRGPARAREAKPAPGGKRGKR